MTSLRDITAGISITGYVQHIGNPTPVIVTSTALDGTPYMQIIGEPGTTVTATVYVDGEGKRLLRAALAAGDMMRFESFGVVEYGRMTEVQFDHVGRSHYRAEITAVGEDYAE